jgi:hypothetical protein
MARDASQVEIFFDSGDTFAEMSSHVLFAETRFSSSANAIPGDMTIVMKDPDRSLSFRTGTQVQVFIDGVPLWGGILTTIRRKHFFPVVDSSDLTRIFDRKWLLSGPDFNILFDKRVIRDESDYFARISTPKGKVGQIIRRYLPQYIESGGVDLFTDVDDTEIAYPAGLWVGQGHYWREQMNDFAQYGGAVYYISATKALQFHSLNHVVSPWGFTDYQPDGVNLIGFREADVNEEGISMITEALVWGGSSLPGEASQNPNEPGSVVFARYPDPPANTQVIPGGDSWTGALAEAVTLEDNTIKPVSMEGMPNPLEVVVHVLIDTEFMYVSKVDGDLLTVVRTDRQEHEAGATIFHEGYPEVTHTAETEQQAIDNIALYGRWQRGEQHAGEPMYLLQSSIDMRAYQIVAGRPGTDTTGLDGGLNRPLWSIGLSWFAHDVPNDQHLHPGDIVDMHFHTLGTSGVPLVLTLPLLSLNVSFPGLDAQGRGYVRFDGQFGISQSDNRFLWRFLLRRNRFLR